MMEEHIQVLKSARFITHGDVNSASKLLFVLHGYGQLPRYFIRKFEKLAALGYYIVAPEGMHRFYLNGTSGRVGASWMTKEARLDDINDNYVLLNSIYKTIKERNPNFSSKILLGFSQGGATASRWMNNNPNLFDQCILWASIFPEDVPFPTNQHQLNYLFVVGEQDPYFTPENIQVLNNEYQKNGIQTFLFQGVHDIDLAVLESVLV